MTNDSEGSREFKDGPGRPAILYVAHRLPYPPDKGDRIRITWKEEDAQLLGS